MNLGQDNRDFMANLKVQSDRTADIIATAAAARHRESNPQIDAFDILQEVLAEFQSRLDDDHELGAQIANSVTPFHVRSVRRSASLFLFAGIDAQEQEVLAIQHFSQLHMQLVKLKKFEDVAYRVGFTAPV